MRAYVKPANPRTNKQKAHRAVLANLVKRYQSIMADVDAKAAWDAEALPYVISGFNLFVKFGRKSKISVSPTSGTAPLTVTITYTLGLPANKAGILMYDGTTWTIIKDKGTLSETPDSSFTYDITAAGTYEFYIADLDVLKSGDTSPQPYQAITKWYPDTTNGVAGEAKVVVS